MHKSRLAGFIIDCQNSDLRAASAFWVNRAEPDVESFDIHPEEYAMSKGMDSKKSDKKAPTKTLKEKRALKQAKKGSK